MSFILGMDCVNYVISAQLGLQQIYHFSWANVINCAFIEQLIIKWNVYTSH
jgi:hypothetical protein